MHRAGRGLQDRVLCPEDIRGAKSPPSGHLPEVPRSVTFWGIVLGTRHGCLTTFCAGRNALHQRLQESLRKEFGPLED